jgi:hypothetical protein
MNPPILEHAFTYVANIVTSDNLTTEKIEDRVVWAQPHLTHDEDHLIFLEVQAKPVKCASQALFLGSSWQLHHCSVSESCVTSLLDLLD